MIDKERAIIFIDEAAKFAKLVNTSIFNAYGKRYKSCYGKQLKVKLRYCCTVGGELLAPTGALVLMMVYDI